MPPPGTGLSFAERERMKALEREVKELRRCKRVHTTIADSFQACPLDRVNRHSHTDRPNQLWVLSTWQGWLYVAFVINVFARRIIGWRVSNIMGTDFVLDDLEQVSMTGVPLTP